MGNPRRMFLLNGAAALAAAIALPGDAFAARKRKRRRRRQEDTSGRSEKSPVGAPKNRQPHGSVLVDLEEGISKLEKDFGLKADDFAIFVNPARQELYLVKDRTVHKTYTISTSKRGLGNKQDSYRTPWGTHRIKHKIGAGAARGTVFKHRENTGKISKIITSGQRGWVYITTRIMCLDGQEAGVNKGPGIDSMERCIYIHGVSGEEYIGTPFSGGCVVMRNDDVIELFDIVPEGTLVEILKKEYESN